MDKEWTTESGELAALYYREVMRTAGFEALCQAYIFQQVSLRLNYEFPVFLVDEVGYKLSKRKEKSRPNQLCIFQSQVKGSSFTNLHFSEDDYEVTLNLDSPQTVLDFIRKEVIWSENET